MPAVLFADVELGPQWLGGGETGGRGRLLG